MGSRGQVTELLGQATAGNRSAHDQLWELLERDLRAIANGMVRRGGSLQPTEVVNEAYVRFAAKERPNIQTQIDFRRYATIIMKNIVREAARRRLAGKRSGGFVRESLTDHPPVGRSPELELRVQDALDSLRTANPLAAEAVELKEYGGFTNEELQVALGVQLDAVKKLLRYGRAQLKAALAPSP